MAKSVLTLMNVPLMVHVMLTSLVPTMSDHSFALATRCSSIDGQDGEFTCACKDGFDGNGFN